MTRPIRVGLLGCGNVGAALVQLVQQDAEGIAARTGVHLEVTRIAVRSLAKDRGLTLADGVLTHEAEKVATDPDVDIVVEVIGGVEPARTLLLDAINAGKPVVTANKELLANVGAELFEAASKANLDLLYEAAVGGGIPLIRPLRESLAGERIRRVMGIVNGTTNYILTKMTEDGASYADALAEAQSLGFAERDPTADVEGYDAGAKAAILATIAFGVKVVAGDVYREGISQLTAADIEFARKLGYVIKLLAVAEQDDSGAVGVRVHPTMVPNTHPLAAVRESFNAVFIEGEAVGDLMLYGRGAGGMPTASAVLGDVIDAAHNLQQGGAGRAHALAKATIRPIDEMVSQYYLTMDVADKPGVLRQVAEVTEHHGVSIKSMDQEAMGESARLVFIVHSAREADMQAAVHELRGLEVVEKMGSLLRVIGTD